MIKLQKLKNQNIFIFALILLTLYYQEFYSQENTSLDCFTIVVGKEASEKGSVIVAHNEDDHGEQVVNLYRVPSKIYSVDEKITLANGGKLNQIEKTNGFIWIELPGMKVSDGFINDKGIVITSNGCPSIEDKPDSSDGGILYWLRRIIAERANTAKEGVKIAGSLIENFGYVSSGRTYTIADKNEAWVLSVVYGKHWIAQRVPDNQVAVIPNYYTIREVNLNDTLNFLGSNDIQSYAISRGWYNPDQNSKFDFAKAYTAPSSINHPGNINRIWRGINLLSNKNYYINEDFPFSFKPYKKIEVNDLMKILRDHYEGSSLDSSNYYQYGDPHIKNYATICSQTTQYSFVAELRDEMPVELGTLIWFTFFKPCFNVYTPIYLGIEEFPQGSAYTTFENAFKMHFNPLKEIFDSSYSLTYWDYVSAYNLISKDFISSYTRFCYINSFIQEDLIKETRKFEAELLSRFDGNKEDLVKAVSNYSKVKLENLNDYIHKISHP